MDKAAEVASNMNIQVLKEPRGFIRIILLIIAIFAFATTTSSRGSSSFSIKCHDREESHTYDYSVQYPFKLNSYPAMSVPDCNNGTSTSLTLYGDFSPPAQFYVFVGVMAFLYCLAGLVLYIFFDEKYRKFDIIPVVDFVVSLVFVLLWLISSSAWAQGVTDVKYYSDPQELFDSEKRLKNNCNNADCTSLSHSPYASLNVSLIFGFLNMLVWGGSLWFLWKETRWFKANQAPAAPPQPQEEPQRI